uniref:Uncharacterized protein n=1 Tax=Anopheles maculatus TaxID=74869 RepID=A0A182T4R2_9DIPT
MLTEYRRALSIDHRHRFKNKPMMDSVSRCNGVISNNTFPVRTNGTPLRKSEPSPIVVSSKNGVIKQQQQQQQCQRPFYYWWQHPITLTMASGSDGSQSAAATASTTTPAPTTRLSNGNGGEGTLDDSSFA